MLFTFWPHKWILLQIREEEEGGSTEADWRFAAMVVKSDCRVDGVALLCSGDRPVVPDSLHCVHPARHRGGPLHRAPCHRRLNRPSLHFSPQPASPSLHSVSNGTVIPFIIKHQNSNKATCLTERTITVRRLKSRVSQFSS